MFRVKMGMISHLWKYRWIVIYNLEFKTNFSKENYLGQVRIMSYNDNSNLKTYSNL